MFLSDADEAASRSESACLGSVGSVQLQRRRVVTGLVAVQLADAILNAIPTQWLRDDLDHLGFPYELRFVFPVIKTASAAGLALGMKRPAVGRATAAALIAYFVIAMRFHARAGDGPLKFLPAAAMLGWSIEAARAYPVPEKQTRCA
jgi:DoxX-like family